MTLYITNVPIRCTINAAIHATTHCPSTTYAAHFAPSSLLIDAIAATHGVYNRQKTNRLAAATGVIAPVSSAVLPKSTESVDTTLSFAINPVISAVEILQSPNTKRKEYRCNDSCHNCQDTVLGICYHIHV